MTHKDASAAAADLPATSEPALVSAPAATPRRSGRDLDWREAAACKGKDPDMWFPERGSTIARAIAICEACPVRVDCLQHALAAKEKFGIWGGLSEKERRTLRRRRATRESLPAVKPHGTLSRFHYGCRCPECRAAYDAVRAAREAS